MLGSFQPRRESRSGKNGSERNRWYHAYPKARTNLDLGTFDLRVEPVVRGEGDRQEGSGDDTSYGREGQRHRGARHLGYSIRLLFSFLDGRQAVLGVCLRLVFR